jgi:hypothetical protein
MMSLLSSSGGVGVVHVENCGVKGGAAGEDWGLLETELLAMSDSDGNMNEDSVEDGAMVLLDVVAARNLPFSSRCIVFASVAIMRLTGVRML